MVARPFLDRITAGPHETAVEGLHGLLDSRVVLRVHMASRFSGRGVSVRLKGTCFAEALTDRRNLAQPFLATHTDTASRCAFFAARAARAFTKFARRRSASPSTGSVGATRASSSNGSR